MTFRGVSKETNYVGQIHVRSDVKQIDGNVEDFDYKTGSSNEKGMYAAGNPIRYFDPKGKDVTVF